MRIPMPQVISLLTHLCLCEFTRGKTICKWRRAIITRQSSICIITIWNHLITKVAQYKNICIKSYKSFKTGSILLILCLDILEMSLWSWFYYVYCCSGEQCCSWVSCLSFEVKLNLCKVSGDFWSENVMMTSLVCWRIQGLGISLVPAVAVAEKVINHKSETTEGSWWVEFV